MTGYRPQFRERVGTTLAEKYMLRNLLGVGGMAAVFEAENTWTGRRVAIKLLTADADGDDETAERFMREARAATRVEHPNIVQVLDMGRDAEDGSLFIVEEYLTGQDLRSLLDTRRKLPVRTALEIMIPVMDALRAAHAEGVVHRDIKPANIFLARTPTGEIFPKVIDFGVVKMASSDGITKTGTTIGTPEYMSPEQAHGDKSIDQQTDVWSTAVVLWEMLAGRCPYENENYHALLVKIIWEPTARIEKQVSDLPAGLADILHRALERDRGMRYEDMREFLDAVLNCPGLIYEPWMQALGNAYGGQRSKPGLHEVTGFIAMPNRAIPSEVRSSLPSLLDPKSLEGFAPPEARTIELEAIDVRSSSHDSMPAEAARPSYTPPPASNLKNRIGPRGIVVSAALVLAGVVGALLAVHTGHDAPRPTRVPAPVASRPTAPVAPRPAPRPQPVVAPVTTPPVLASAHDVHPAPIVAAPIVVAPVPPPPTAPAEPTPAVDRDPPADLVFAPNETSTSRRNTHPAPHQASAHASPVHHAPSPPVTHHAPTLPPHHATPATNHATTVHRTHNGAPILSVP